MNPRHHVRLLVAIGLIAGLLPITIGTVIEAMAPGSIQGQEAWSGGIIPISTNVDQTVDQSGLNQRTGTGAWRISNNTSLGGGHNGAFAGWVFGPGLPVSAGQPSSGDGADQFTATLWFRSASASADGSNIEIDLGSVLGDDRNTFLALTNRADADDGLQLRASEPDPATGIFRPTAIIATGITRSAWHRLDIVANFFDGPANDTVAYALDGVPLANPAGGTTFGTFEAFFAANSSPYVLSNRLFFRSGAAPSAFGAAFVNTAAQGFYFDDLFYAVANQSAPAIRLAAYATGFEPGFSAGSIQSQEAWSGGIIPISTNVDQTVDQSGLNQRTGTGAWRISNNTSLGGGHNGAFAGWVFGPGLPVSAGQPSSGDGADQFTATLWFRSASASADGSNIEIDLGSVLGDDRNTFLALTNRADADDGLQLRASEPDPATGIFRPTAIIATGITRSAWHRLDIVANFFDGPANDTVAYALDGVPLANPAGGTTFGTFEAFFAANSSPYVLSNRLFFRSGAAPSAFGAAFVNTAAQGFYFDDLFYAVANQSAPATSLAAYATGFEPPAVPAPDLTISKSHVGNFMQGQIGAQFTVTVTNSGTPSTIGVVTLTDTVPTGLTPATASGTGWTCGISVPVVTCTRSDALPPGASYPPVTITVNVANNAPASVANTAAISGGGDVNTANNTATDVTTILAETPLPPEDLPVGFFAYDPAFTGGITVAAGDVTGDGVADIITGAGAGGGPHVAVFSLMGGVVTQVASFFAYDPAFAGGITVAAGDVTGDGVADIITGAGAGGGPHVAAFSLTGGVVTQVASFFAYDPAFAGGITVAAGDVTGDGVADIITGAGAGGEPQVGAFSLAGGVVTQVASFFAYDPAFAGGITVAAGDVTGDGVADIITGPGAGGGPHVAAFSLTGSVVTQVASFFAYDPAFAGGITVAAGDVTGDGVADIITGAGAGGGPHVAAFSLTGSVVTQVASFFAYDPAFAGGITVAAGDVTGDGVADIITGPGAGGGPHVGAFSLTGSVVTVK